MVTVKTFNTEVVCWRIWRVWSGPLSQDCLEPTCVWGSSPGTRGLTHCEAAGALGRLEDPCSCPIVTGGL